MRTTGGVVTAILTAVCGKAEQRSDSVLQSGTVEHGRCTAYSVSALWLVTALALFREKEQICLDSACLTIFWS